MEGEQPDLTGGGRPVDENKRKRLAPVAVVELVREQHVSGGVLGEFWWDSEQGSMGSGGSGWCKVDVQTLSEFIDGDIVEELDLLKDELGFVDLDDECGAALAPPEAKFAQGVFDGLWDINGLRLHGVLVAVCT